MDFFLVQVLVLFLPGLIWARLDAAHAMKQKPSESELLLRALMYGLTSYAVLYVIYGLCDWEFSLVAIPKRSNDAIDLSALSDEILWSIPLSVILATLWVASVNRKLAVRVLQKIGATKRYGDGDVWDFTFNSTKAAVEYVHFRDFSQRLVFAGWVDTFSETDKLRELVLSDVKVYDFDGNELFETPLLYIARNPADIHIEFPYDK